MGRIRKTILKKVVYTCYDEMLIAEKKLFNIVRFDNVLTKARKARQDFFNKYDIYPENTRMLVYKDEI